MDNPAAWHPDPAGKHDHRWWDGQRWTEHVADAGVASIDPLPDAPGPGDDAAATADADTSADPAGGTSADPAAGDPPGTDVGADAPTPGGGDPAPPWGASPSSGDAPGGTGAVWGEQPAPQQPTSQQPVWGSAPPASTSWDQQASGGGAGGAGASGSNGMAIGALVTGILSLPLLLLFGFGALLGVVAVILGIIALRRAGRYGGQGRGQAIGGIVTGAISVVLGIVFIIFFVSFGSGIYNEMERCLEETGGDDAECQRRLERELTERFLGE